MSKTQFTAWRGGDAGTAIFYPKDPNGGAPKYLASNLRREDVVLITRAAQILERLEDCFAKLQEVEQFVAIKDLPYGRAYINDLSAFLSKVRRAENV